MSEVEKVLKIEKASDFKAETIEKQTESSEEMIEKTKIMVDEVKQNGDELLKKIQERNPKQEILDEFKDKELLIEGEAKISANEFGNNFSDSENIESGDKKHSIEIDFYDKNNEKIESKDEHKDIIEKALKVVNEENAYYRKFFKGEDVISKVEFNESKDNYFANDEGKLIDIPLRNPENTEETLPILRHESFHEAMRVRNGEKDKSAKEQLSDNIKEGKDTNLEVLGLNIKSGKFKKFIDGKRSILIVVDITYGKINPATHLENDIEEIIEEKLADEMMLKREKEKNPDKAIENVVRAKIVSLDNIAKNKGLDSYENINPFSRAGFKGFISNYYNTYRFLSRISFEDGRREESERFAQIADNGRKKMESNISKMFEKKEWEEIMKEKYGYTKEELLSEINELLKELE